MKNSAIIVLFLGLVNYSFAQSNDAKKIEVAVKDSIDILNTRIDFSTLKGSGSTPDSPVQTTLPTTISLPVKIGSELKSESNPKY
jgi:hypothetical protein